jgi:phage gp29-like protein
MAQILDRFGNPIAREVLAEPQTAQMMTLHQSFAEHPSRGLTPAKLARILEDAERGDITAQHELFMDMEEKDAHIHAEISKRKRALLTLQWDVQPPRNASRQEADDAAWLADVLTDLANFEDVLLDALDAVGHGFAALEIAWGRQGREWLPEAVYHRPQTWFQYDRETRSRLRLRDNSAEGAELTPFGWIVHTHQAKSGYPARAGLHRILAWPFLFKNYSVRDLAEFLEIYGLPLRLGKYPPGASNDEKATLLRAVVNIGHNAAGIIPEGMALEILEAAEGSEAPFIAMAEYCERLQSKAILGGTLTSQADGKSSTNALGNVHNEVRHDLLQSDARQLAGTLTRDLLYPLLALNRGSRDPRRAPRLTFDTSEPEDIAVYAEAIPKLVAVGMPIPAGWVREKLGIPEAAEGEAVLSRLDARSPETRSPDAAQRNPGDSAHIPDSAPAASGLPATQKAPKPAALAALAADRVAGAGKTIASAYTDQAVIDAARPDQTLADAAMANLLRPIFEAMRQGESYEQILAEMGEWYPQMDDAALVELLTRALFAAELVGRISVESEQAASMPETPVALTASPPVPEPPPAPVIHINAQINLPEGLVKPAEVKVEVAQPHVQIDNHVAVPQTPVPVVNVAPAAVTIDNQVVVPPRQTVTEIERDADGNIVRAVQRDAED